MNRLYSDFAIKLSLSVYDARNLISPEFPEVSYKKQKKFLSDNFNVAIKTNSNRKVAVFVEFLTVSTARVKCRHLNEFNECSIYLRRPLVCSLYPYRIDVVPSEMKHGLLIEKSRSREAKEGDMKCEGFTDFGEVIFTDRPSDNTVLHDFNSRVKELSLHRRDIKAFIQYIIKGEQLMQEIEHNSQYNAPTGKRITLSLADYAKFKISESGYLPSSVKRLLEHNGALLDMEADRMEKLNLDNMENYIDTLRADALTHHLIVATHE